MPRIPGLEYLSGIISRGNDKRISGYASIDEVKKQIATYQSNPGSEEAKSNLTLELERLRVATGVSDKEINNYVNRIAPMKALKYEFNSSNLPPLQTGDSLGTATNDPIPEVAPSAIETKLPEPDEALKQEYRDKFSLGARVDSRLSAELNPDVGNKDYKSRSDGATTPPEEKINPDSKASADSHSSSKEDYASDLEKITSGDMWYSLINSYQNAGPLEKPHIEKRIGDILTKFGEETSLSGLEVYQLLDQVPGGTIDSGGEVGAPRIISAKERLEISGLSVVDPVASPDLNGNYIASGDNNGAPLSRGFPTSSRLDPLRQRAGSAASNVGSSISGGASAGKDYVLAKAPVVASYVKEKLIGETVDPLEVQNFQNHLQAKQVDSKLTEFKDAKAGETKERLGDEIEAALEEYRVNQGLDTEDMVKLRGASGITDKLRASGYMVGGGRWDADYKPLTPEGGDIERYFKESGEYGKKIELLLDQLNTPQKQVDLDNLATFSNKKLIAHQISEIAEKFKEDAGSKNLKLDELQTYWLLHETYGKSLENSGFRVTNPRDFNGQGYVEVNLNKGPGSLREVYRAGVKVVGDTRDVVASGPSLRKYITIDQKLPERAQGAVQKGKEVAARVGDGVTNYKTAKAEGNHWYSGVTGILKPPQKKDDSLKKLGEQIEALMKEKNKNA